MTLSRSAESRAIVMAAVIGVVGAVAAALVGREWGERRAESDTSRLESRLQQQEQALQALQAQLAAKDITIQSLKEGLPGKRVANPSTRDPRKTEAATDRSPVLTTSAPPSVGASTPQRIDEGNGLRVELHHCTLPSDKLVCSFSVTSTTKDRNQYLRRSRLIERDGNELEATAQQFGRETSDKGRQVNTSLVRGIPIRATVTFDSINTEIVHEGVRLIELQFDALTAQFRDVRPD